MKIGIVTHPLFHNYGGTLQAFAMQESLRRLGHNPITIDYLPNKMSKGHYLMAQIKTLFYYLTFRTNRKFFKYPQRVRSPKFQDFMDKYMILTERVHKYKVSTLKKYQVEAIVVGSDQVWRGAYHHPSEQPDLFLRFAKKYNVPKIAYAASFGTNEWEYSDNLTKECANLAQLFTAISTREDSGVELCKRYLSVCAVGMNDPTLLLDKVDYSELCKNIPIHRQRYILAYLLDITNEQKMSISKFAQVNQLQVIFCTSETDIEMSVEEWLALYRDAAFVVTNSFHGTVFSIINNVNFYSIIHVNRGADRFVSLLSRFKLRDRLINNIKELPQCIKSIEWDKVNEIKKIWKERGLLFLKNNLAKDEYYGS